MPGRVVAQWDKDDCDDLGIIKVDLLGLGMMAVMQDTIELCARSADIRSISRRSRRMIAAIYDLMPRADTIGIFQIESRAQMATLPRMKPQCFYDVVVEVAIIRPGPIQGDMVHPYLARRAGKEKVTYYRRAAASRVLERTLGVPLFQEQLLEDRHGDGGFHRQRSRGIAPRAQLSSLAGEDGKSLRETARAMAAKNVDPEVVEKIVQAVQSFAVYGFPESPRDQLCPDRLCELLAESASRPEFFCASAQQSADGLLQQCHADS